MDKEKRIYGLLVGCAYGDAMGMPSEMMSEKIFHKAFCQKIDSFLPSTPYDFLNRKFQKYQVTDDTMNTLLICDSILKNQGKFSVESYLALLEEWMQKHSDMNSYIIGPSTKRALEGIKNGVSMKETGKQGTTNGACMKSTPLGIICDYHKLSHLVDTVYSMCLPTHNTNIAVMGTSVLVSLVSYILRDGTSVEEMWDIMYQCMDIAKDKGNQLPSPSLKKRMQIVQSNQLTINQLQELFGSGMETIETVPMVLAIVFSSSFDPIRAANVAANLYGDTDTIGAIATAICGAYNCKFKAEDIKNLEKVNSINFKYYAEHLKKYFV